MRLFFFFTIICLLPVGLIAQNKITISGKIKNKAGNPISFASIGVEGTSFDTYSDEKGSYSLEILQGRCTITISSFGYKTQKIPLKITNNKRQDFILEEKTVELSAVEISGKTKSQQLRESSFSANAIDVKSYTSSINNLKDLIGRSSGIRIRENGGVGSDFDLSINGMSGNSVRYFIDGIPLSVIGNGVSINNIPINIVDRIEVYKGVVPSEFGTDALGGVINIVTKKDTKNYIDVSYGLGSFHTHKTDLNTQYIDQKTGLFIRPMVGLNYSKNDYKMKRVQVPTEDREAFKVINAKRFHDDYFSFLGQLNIGIANKKWTDFLSLTASYSYTDSEIQTGTVQEKVYGMATEENKAYYISAQYQKKDILLKGLSADLSVSHTWDLSIIVDTAYRQYDWSGKYNIPSGQGSEISGREKSIRHTKRPLTVGRSNFNYRLNTIHSFSLNYLLNHINNNRSDEFDIDGFVPSKDAFTKHITGFSYKQDFWNDRWSNTFFVKNYVSHLKIGQQDLAWITGSKDMPKSSTSTNWGYGFSSRFRFFGWLSAKISAERSMRLPLAREYMGNGSTIYPNFMLKPENSRNFNLGLFGTIDIAPQHILFYETNMFYRVVKDYIRLDPSDKKYENVKNVTVKGIEGELRYDYNNTVQAIANISYMDEMNKTKYTSEDKPNVSYNNRMPNSPWLYGNIELNYRKKNILGKKDSQMKAAYYFQYVDWFYLGWKGYGAVESKSKIPTQCIHNLSLTYSLRNERYNLSLECNNIFDRLAFDNYKMQKPGRSFFCKLRVFIN